MKKIEFYTSYSERQNKHYYEYAYIAEELPKVGDHVSYIYDDEIVTSVFCISIDCEQPRRENFEYDFFEIGIEDANNSDDIDCIYLAIKREEEEGSD